MATYTPNLNLKKPEGSDYVLIGDINGNMDSLDTAIGKLSHLNTAIKTNLVEAINEANSSGANAPYIGENGNWFEWDPAMGMYVDTNTPAMGPEGSIGPQGLQGNVGPTGPAAGFGVPEATASTLDAGEQATVTVTATGEDTEKVFSFDFGIPKGDRGEPGATGPQGPTGRGFAILGYYETEASLESSVLSPSAGDAYGVGTTDPYDVYIWDGVNLIWVNNGPLQGAEGKQGATFTPAVDSNGTLSWTNDREFENPEPVNIMGPRGAQGPAGSDGVAGPAGPNEITGETVTTINGILTGNGANVRAAVSGTDYAAPPIVGTEPPTTATVGVIGQLYIYNGRTYTLTSIEGASYTWTEGGSGGGAGYSPNLLDNWDFRNPVNQRQITAFTEGAYGLDRWILLSGTCAVEEGYITLNGTLAERMEYAPADFPYNGEAMTLSALLAGGTVKSVSLTPDAGADVSASIDGLTFSLVNGESWKEFHVAASAATQLLALKLERGSASTLAGDGRMDYAQALLRCWRFQWLPLQTGQTAVTLGNDSALSTTNVNIAVSMPVPMRLIAPTVSIKTSILRLYMGSTAIFGTSCTVAPEQSLDGRVVISVTADGGLTAGSLVTLRLRASVINVLDAIFDANL